MRLRLAKVVKPTYRLHIGARVNAALLTYLLTYLLFIVQAGFELTVGVGVEPLTPLSIRVEPSNSTILVEIWISTDKITWSTHLIFFTIRALRS